MQQVEDKLLSGLSFFLSVDKTISLLISVLTTNHFVYTPSVLKYKQKKKKSHLLRKPKHKNL